MIIEVQYCLGVAIGPYHHLKITMLFFFRAPLLHRNYNFIVHYG